MEQNQFPKASASFEWFYILFAGLWTAGAYIDGWAHIHLFSSLESFFTPWHGIFYGGMTFTGALLATELYRNHRRGYSLYFALPREYRLALAGVIIAFIGGIGDLLWHTIFGIEIGVEALLSPTHIIIAIGGAIAVGGPFHAVWYRHREESLRIVPTILSFVYCMSIMTFMLQFLSPFKYPWAAASFFAMNPTNFNYAVSLGIASVFIFTGIFMGLTLSSIKHWLYPFGSFTAILGLNISAMAFMVGGQYRFILTATLAGLLIDMMYSIVAPRTRGEYHIRMFSFCAPAVFFSIYFATLFLTDRIMWSVHMWTGAIMLSGVTGLLMSYFLFPPREQNS